MLIFNYFDINLSRTHIKYMKFTACVVFSAGCFLCMQQMIFRQPEMVLHPPADVQVGDWVFRSGTSHDSFLIKHLSQSAYSHVGMVVQTLPEIMVAHATSDDDPEQPNQVLLSKWADFVSPKRADAVAVARLQGVSSAQRFQAALYARQQVGRAFVVASRDDAPFYCTLLLTEAWSAQGVALQTRWQYVDVPVLRGEYLFPQGLLDENLLWVHQQVR